jgi:glucosylceramidase
VSDTYDNVRLVHDAYPDKRLVFTEGTEASFNRNRLDDWRWGERFARSIILDLNNWANGWIFWNVLLDEQGGPNHVGNYCMAPIIADTQTGELHYMNSYWYLGHFSRFIKKGAKRIVCSSNTDNLLATAFVNPDGGLAVVVANFGERARGFQVWLDGKAAKTNSPAHSIITMLLK